MPDSSCTAADSGWAAHFSSKSSCSRWDAIGSAKAARVAANVVSAVISTGTCGRASSVLSPRSTSENDEVAPADEAEDIRDIGTPVAIEARGGRGALEDDDVDDVIVICIIGIGARA